jgi:pimeloyl-ACP methyl ester carboxylesterase
MSKIALLLAPILVLSACGDKDVDDTSPQDTAPDFVPPEGGVIQLEARDGVMLEADYYPSDHAGAPSIVLLHMYAVYYDRSDWPLDFIELLGNHGWTVIVPDRRGAGNSEGDPEESWDGEKGKWDVEACTLKLQEDGYGPPAIIGASNGTTSMIDYAIWAPEEGLPEPVALGFMTGGTYTIANSFMSDLPVLPAIFTYSTAEASWSEGKMDDNPGDWEFFEYPNGDHGTLMFEAAPEVAQDIEGFLLKWLEDLG